MNEWLQHIKRKLQYRANQTVFLSLQSHLPCTKNPFGIVSLEPGLLYDPFGSSSGFTSCPQGSCMDYALSLRSRGVMNPVGNPSLHNSRNSGCSHREQRNLCKKLSCLLPASGFHAKKPFISSVNHIYGQIQKTTRQMFKVTEGNKKKLGRNKKTYIKR